LIFFKGIETMKRQLMTIGMVVASLIAATAFADNASTTQMNGQMGQMQAPATSADAQGSAQAPQSAATDNNMPAANAPATTATTPPPATSSQSGY
jgi:hypothetical protein